MEELYIEGLANHDDRKPCVDDPQGRGEASVAACAGQVDFANLFWPHFANISWPHQDRLPTSSGPTRNCLWRRGEASDQGSSKEVLAPVGWGQKKLPWPGGAERSCQGGAEQAAGNRPGIEPRNHRVRGADVVVTRFADDFVVGFQYLGDAKRFLNDLRQRFAKFNLELHPDKARLIEFGRFAAPNRTERGLGKPETFDFLGFTHVCGKARDGRFWLRRISIKKESSPSKPLLSSYIRTFSSSGRGHIAPVPSGARPCLKWLTCRCHAGTRPHRGAIFMSVWFDNADLSV